MRTRPYHPSFLSFLYANYRPGVRLLEEAVEMVRKVLLTGVALLVLRGTLSQNVLGLLVADASMLAYSQLKPFRDLPTYSLALLAQVCLMLTLLSGVLASTALADSYDSQVVAAITIVLNMRVPLVGGCVMVYLHGVVRWRSVSAKHDRGVRLAAFFGLSPRKGAFGSLCCGRSQASEQGSVELQARSSSKQGQAHFVTNPLNAATPGSV